MQGYRGPVTTEGAMLIPERELSQTVYEMATALGWKVFRVWMSIKSVAGFPDLLLVRPGRIIAAELKSETGKVRQNQQEWLDALALAGTESYLWRPSDLISGKILQILSGP